MGWYLGHKGLLAPPPPSQCAHVACFCTFFKNFHVRLGKKTKTVSLYSGVCMCKGKTTTCFFSIFFWHLSLTQKLILALCIYTATSDRVQGNSKFWIRSERPSGGFVCEILRLIIVQLWVKKANHHTVVFSPTYIYEARHAEETFKN